MWTPAHSHIGNAGFLLPSWRFHWCRCHGNALSLWQTSLPSPTKGIAAPLGELLTWVSGVGNLWTGSRGHWDAAVAQLRSPAQVTPTSLVIPSLELGLLLGWCWGFSWCHAPSVLTPGCPRLSVSSGHGSVWTWLRCCGAAWPWALLGAGWALLAWAQGSIP